jgi:hypothetical protein
MASDAHSEIDDSQDRRATLLSLALATLLTLLVLGAAGGLLALS